MLRCARKDDTGFGVLAGLTLVVAPVVAFVVGPCRVALVVVG